MALVIGGKPDSSFDNPIGLLSDCHRRIEKFLQQLQLVAREAQGDSLSEEHRHALEIALRYFREAAPRHTKDEEQSLFPRMRAVDEEETQSALAALEALEADHQAADTAHQEVDALGGKWLAEGRLAPADHMRLVQLLEELVTLYSAHIRLEDTQVFPIAERALSADEIKAVGREMAERRGIDLSKVPDLKLRCPTRRQP